MIYGFDTNDEAQALASLLVYGCYMSRDVKKFKISPEMWGIIERGCKSSAKRAQTIHDFIEKFKEKVSCSSLKPKFMMSHVEQQEILIQDGNGGFISKKDNGERKFWINLIEEADDNKVLNELYNHTSFVIILVRDRLEREKMLRNAGLLQEDTENEND